MKKNKISGFTLAEVLITLTIIGVIAAMTIPTLMSKYQEQAFKSQLKKSYSVLNHAMALNSDYYCSYEDYNANRNNCNDFWIAVLENLKVTKHVEISEFPYKTQAQVIAGGGKVLNTTCSVGRFTYKDKYYLADGTTIYLQVKRSDNGVSWQNLHFILDVNGDKGPNKWGYDVFYLLPERYPDNSLKVSDMVCTIWEKGGTRPLNILTGIEEIIEHRF